MPRIPLEYWTFADAHRDDPTYGADRTPPVSDTTLANVSNSILGTRLP